MAKKDLPKELVGSIFDEDGVVEEGKLNELIIKETIRPDGSRRLQYDYSFCTSRTDVHSAHLTDLNYLIEKYKPDELAQYIAARSQYRAEILGHDFSQEPNLQDAKNLIYKSRQEFENLPEDIRMHFRSHLDFLKFMENPQNKEKAIKIGLLSPEQIDKIEISKASQELVANKPSEPVSAVKKD